MLTPTLICLPMIAPLAIATPEAGLLAISPAAVSAAPLAAPLAQADAFYGDATWHTLRWKYMQVDRQSGDPDGWKFSGSYPVAENIYIFGSDLFLQEDGLNGTLLKLGAGYHMPLDLGMSEGDMFSETEAYGQFAFQHLNVSGGTVAGQEDGFELGGGVRSIVTDRVEAQVEVGYTEIDASGLNNFYFNVRGEYEFTRNVAATVGFQVDDEEYLNVGVRFYPDMQ